MNFHKVLDNIDVTPLLKQIKANPQLWNTDDSWTKFKPDHVAIYNVDDIVLRFNKSPEWTKPAWHVLTAAQSIIFDVMRAIPGEHLGKIIITRLHPGETIAPHIDMMPPDVPIYWQRYQIPLSGLALFKCGDEELVMQPGCAYHFNNQLTHSVENHSNEARISMLTDIRPFT